MNALKILMVEDNEGDALLIREYLSEINPETELDWATSLGQALSMINSQPYDIILLDLFLPDSQGFVTCMTLLDKFPEANIIVLTGMTDSQLGEWASKMGAKAFLFKNDLSSEILGKSIQEAMNGSN